MSARRKERDRPSDRSLEDLAEDCIAARSLIESVGTPAMRALIDELLLEIGHALAGKIRRRVPDRGR